jgi:hypothetical protein
MRTILLAALLLTTSCFAQDRVEPLVKAIAKAEGFNVKNTLPTRCHNPGDIKALRNYRFPGQVGVRKQYVVFKSDKAGWEALRHQIEKIIAGESRYSVNLTLKQLGKRYAESSIWPRVVAKYLSVTPETYLWEILDTPPALESKWFTS